jgi:hypothetical protein
MAIAALKTESGARDFHENVTVHRTEGEVLSPAMQYDQSSPDPNSLGGANGASTNNIDSGKQYLFIAKDMAKEQKAKQPTLEVSVAKHIADSFNFKPRCQVLITTVRNTPDLTSHIKLTIFRLILQPPLHLMWSCPSKMNICLGPICGDWL